MSLESVDLGGFAEILRDRTKDVHREAERSGFIAELIRGRATRQGYALFLCNLVPAYAALERALDRHATTPVVAAFAAPGLRRLPALRADLAALGAPQDPVLPEAAAYAAAIEAAAHADGLRLAAHAYARYLGDLSGGQILKPLLARHFGLGADALGFYDFPALSDLPAAKAAMRMALDEVPPSGPQAETFVMEAISAFRHNIAVSRAVLAALG